MILDPDLPAVLFAHVQWVSADARGCTRMRRKTLAHYRFLNLDLKGMQIHLHSGFSCSYKRLVSFRGPLSGLVSSGVLLRTPNTVNVTAPAKLASMSVTWIPILSFRLSM